MEPRNPGQLASFPATLRFRGSIQSGLGRHNRPLLLDDFLPVYDVSDTVAVVVGAGPDEVWEALLRADLIEVGRRRPAVGLLGGLRVLPEVVSHLLHGEAPPHLPKTMTLKETTRMPMGEGGWAMLAERPGEEIALGLVGRFWRPVIEYAEVTAGDFAAFDQPGFGKTVYSLAVEPLPEHGCLLTGTMRTATTDEHARRWFRRYWTFGVGSGAHVLVQALLDMVREEAENGEVAL